MIKIENVSTFGWEAAIRGARNPMNSWDKSDSLFYNPGSEFTHNIVGDRLFVDPGDDQTWTYSGPTEKRELYSWAIDNSYDIDELSEKADFNLFNGPGIPAIGPNDLKLLSNLAMAGSDEAKFRRMIVVYVDITAPMYWWKEADTYKVGTVRNSCSTMHKIHAKEFTLDDFSTEHLLKDEDRNIPGIEKICGVPVYVFDEDKGVYAAPFEFYNHLIAFLNHLRKVYLVTKDKRNWWQMIQLLPSSYNQRATLMLNYEVLSNMYHARKNHKLNCWRKFCAWIETLPYAKELIIGEEIHNDDVDNLKACLRLLTGHARYLEETLTKELYTKGDMSISQIANKVKSPDSDVRKIVGDLDLGGQLSNISAKANRKDDDVDNDNV